MAGLPQSYPEWCKAAQRWHSESCDVSIPDKPAVVSTVLEPKHVSTSKPYRPLLAAQRALAHVTKVDSPSHEQLASMHRKLKAIHLDPSQELMCVMTATEKRIAELFVTKQGNAQLEWKVAVHAWGMPSKQLYRT